MKKSIYLLLLIALTTATSCTFTVGDTDNSTKKENKDHSGDGFMYEDVSILINGLSKIKNNELIAGQQIVITFEGVKNATLKDEFQHVGIKLKVINENGEILEESEDLYSNIEQQNPGYSEFFFRYPILGLSKEGEKITFQYELYDKYGDISYEFEDTYTITHKRPFPTEGMKLTSNIENLDAVPQVKRGYFQYESAPIKLGASDELDFYICGVNELMNNEGIIDVTYTITLKDDSDKTIFEKTDVLSGDIKETIFPYFPLFFDQTFPEDAQGEFTWNVAVQDNLSDKYLNLSTTLEIE